MRIEALISIISFVIVLIILAYLGHLLWLGISWLFRATFMRRRCPGCGRRLIGNESCLACENARLDLRSRPTVSDDLKAAERLRQYAGFQGWLDDDQNKYLEECLTRLSYRISGTPAPTLSSPASSSMKSVEAPPSPTLAPTTEPVVDVIQAQIVAPHVHALDADYEPTIAATASKRLDPAALASAASSAGNATIAPQLQAQVLRSFMERSNIRWVELVSASLVVVCSVGLVISLWSTLSRTSRFFPSLVFMLATLAVHGAGQYTLKRWKLRTTSRGILHIGLMLIPLSVLVGILLAHRQGAGTDFVFNLGSCLAIGVGLLVYVALAVTASRSLFMRYFAPIAACNIVGSAVLLPIDLTSTPGSAAQWSIAALVPVVLVSMVVSLLLTRQAAWRTRWTSAYARRHMGMAVQALFVTLTACVFWYLKFKPSLSVAATAVIDNAADTGRVMSQLDLHASWWLAIGLLGVAWSAWGWSASVARGTLVRRGTNDRTGLGGATKTVDRDASWFVVAGAVLAMLATSAVAVGVWQANHSRVSMATLLAIGGLWWILHGALSRLSLPQWMGSLSLIVAGALGAESWHVGWSESLVVLEWIGQERLTWLTIMGAASTALAAIYLGVSRSRVLDGNRIDDPAAEHIDQFIIKHVVMAGCAVMLVSACLTVMAACVPLGATPFGGGWAAWYLAFYGLTLSAVGVAIERNQRLLPSIQAARWIAPLLLPLGMAVTILATIRFMQASEWMPEWIVALRPARAWSVGLTSLATVWALVAVALKQCGWQSQLSRVQASNIQLSSIGSIDWLNLFAIATSAISLIGLVRLSDHLSLVSQVQWQLPILCAAVWWTWHSSHARESVVLTSCAWSMATLYAMGYSHDWWLTWPLVVSVSSHLAIACGVCFVAALTSGQLMQRRPREQSMNAWMFQPSYWATIVIVLGSMVALLLSLALPSVHNLAVCLGLATTPENNVSEAPLAIMQPSVFQAMGVVGTIILWSLLSWHGSRLPQLGWLRLAIGLSPVMLALTLTATVPSAYALAICLSVLSVSLIASEAMTLFFKSWSQLSEEGWQLMSARQRDAQPAANLLLIGRTIAVGCLLGLTGLAIFLGWDGRLSAHLLPAVDLVSATHSSGRWSRLWAVLSWMWPAIAFLAVRWSFIVARDCGPGRVALVGTVLSAAIACTASLVGMAAIIPFLYGSIAWLQWFVIAIAVLAGVSAGSTWLRNFIGLRAIDRGHSSSLALMSKAAGGGRWKRAVTGAHQMLWSGLGCMLVLCVIAAASNIFVPVRALESIHAMSDWASVWAYLLLAAVMAALWQGDEGRGRADKLSLQGIASYAALLALLLGMLAPLGAIFYADWLQALPSRYSPVARQFEPYRAQVVGWLVALAIGLVVRLSTAQRRWATSGEVMWLSLALLVGLLAFVSSAMDPEPIWPAMELGGLALIAVLSGCFSGQAWRGHIAALIAGAACLVYAFPLSLNETANWSWQVLFGPLLVAAASLLWHLFTQRLANAAEQVESDAASAAWRQSLKTVDQTVSQHVPVFISLATCLWIFLTDLNATEFHWPVVAAVGAGAWLLAVGRLWDVRRGGRGSAIYMAFIAAALTVSVLISYFNGLPLATRGLMWMACGLGALATVAGCLREWQRESSKWIPALRLGKLSVQQADFERARRWIVPWHSLVGLMLLIPCGLLALSLDQRALRLANAALPLLSGLSILPIAIDVGQRYSRAIGLWFLSIPLVLFLWADLPSLDWNFATAETWYYAQRAMLALVLLGWGHWALTHWLVGKLDWPEQLTHSSWISFIAAATAGVWMLVSESFDWWPGFTESIELSVKIAWLLAWAGLIARAIQFALRPMGLDAGATLRSRQAAVYAAEIGLALFAASTYVCFPHMFQGLVADWWPLVVYGIAMLSAGIGHWAAKNQQEVIADPVRRSSLLLPLVPLLGVWLPFSRELNIDWSDWQSYSMILFGGAALYAMHGWLKPSVKLHALAGVLVLLSFWALLHSRPSLRFFAHPQFWVVPPAIATLIFVEANRRRLDAGVVTAVRYIAILLAYLSSTAEIVLKAFEGQMWQPLLLLMLAVLGVLAGIALRVRAFLYCGSTFVMVALLGMVWHAQQAIDQVWPWWAFGILTGVSLIAMLGYFEKNRPRVLAYVDRLKSWQ